mmetsp:Transcript_11719/g.22716  ORF Transcript_11719/g.22716 Transcript_11719/m.22716 type:complete len:294 (-) Transcript_11719:38-919(-)
MIGWIGTGVMGKAMAEHLINAGHKLMVFNKPATRTDALVAKGARFAPVHEIAANCNTIVTMLGYPRDVQEVVMNPGGLLSLMKPGSLLVDHTTSSPNLAREIFAAAKAKGIDAIDAPVSGGDVGAKNATLALMVGGEKEAFDKASLFMKHYGSNLRHMGDAGFGQHTKLANQIILAGNMIGMVEGIVYSYKAGLNVETIVELLNTGAAGSTVLKIFGPRMLQRDFEPGFHVDHFIKDMGIALDECRRMNLSLPGLSLVQQLYISCQAYQEGNRGCQVLIKALERLNNIEVKVK